MNKTSRTAASISAAAMPTGISYLVGRLERLLRRRLNDVLSRHGLTVQQYTMLAMLGARGPLSNAQLAERSFITPQTANEMVKSMEGRGWIARNPDPDHGRIIHLSLTRKGKDQLARCYVVAAELEAAMLSTLEDDERELLRSYLKSCIHALGAQMAEGEH